MKTEAQARAALERLGYRLTRKADDYGNVGYMIVGASHGGVVSGSEAGNSYELDLRQVGDWIAAEEALANG